MVKSLIFFLVLIPTIAWSVDLEDSSYKDALSLEKRYLSQLLSSTIEVLIPVRANDQTNFVLSTVRPIEELEKDVKSIAQNRWNPDVRVPLLLDQLTACIDVDTTNCMLFDGLFPMKAIHFISNNREYIFIQKDIATKEMEERGVHTLRDLSGFQKGDQTFFGLYSIPKDQLIVQNLVFEGEYSTLYRDSSNLLRNVTYSVFSHSTLVQESDLIQEGLGDCDTYVFDPPPSPQTKGRVCLKAEKLYVGGILNVITLEKVLEEVKNKRVSVIELNSSGGSFFSLAKTKVKELASLIREKKIRTNIREKAHCGSLCTILYQAGEIRTAHWNSDLLFHGPQWPERARSIQAQCHKEIRSVECDKWEGETQSFFMEYIETLLEFNIDPRVVNIILSQEDDEDWLKSGNLLKKKDLILSPSEALDLNIVQEVYQ